MHIRLKYAAVLALPALASAVSLAEWTPQAKNLPAACEAIYTAPIPGCNAHDFTSGRCSSGCVTALEELVEPVKRACAGKGVTGKNLIVAFLSNVGPQQICPNAANMSPTFLPPPGSPTASATSRWHKHHGPPFASSWSGTTTASSLSPTDTSSLVVDTSSRTKHHHMPQKTKTKTKTTSSTSTTSSSAPSQLNTGDGSGGGSPFDTAGNLASGAVHLSLNAAMVFLSAGVALVVLR